jgi:hypothetical protein
VKGGSGANTVYLHLQGSSDGASVDHRPTRAEVHTTGITSTQVPEAQQAAVTAVQCSAGRLAGRPLGGGGSPPPNNNNDVHGAGQLVFQGPDI